MADPHPALSQHCPQWRLDPLMVPKKKKANLGKLMVTLHRSTLFYLCIRVYCLSINYLLFIQFERVVVAMAALGDETAGATSLEPLFGSPNRPAQNTGFFQRRTCQPNQTQRNQLNDPSPKWINKPSFLDLSCKNCVLCAERCSGTDLWWGWGSRPLQAGFQPLPHLQG